VEPVVDGTVDVVPLQVGPGGVDHWDGVSLRAIAPHGRPRARAAVPSDVHRLVLGAHVRVVLADLAEFGPPGIALHLAAALPHSRLQRADVQLGRLLPEVRLGRHSLPLGAVALAPDHRLHRAHSAGGVQPSGNYFLSKILTENDCPNSLSSDKDNAP